MKKILLTTAGIIGLMLLASSYQNSVNAQVIGDVTLPDPPDENICRCKDDGCYGGNLISLRPRCGQGDCTQWIQNCPS